MLENITPELRKKINQTLKNSNVINELCDDFDVDVEIIDFVPMCFDDELDVSARTEHGIIYFNAKLKESEDIFHYTAHELTHVIEQCFGEKATAGSTDDNYLSNIHEQYGFNTQTEFISETEGPEEAEKYINLVLDHHNVKDDEREEKKDELLAIASSQLKLFEKKVKERSDDSDRSEDIKRSKEIVKALENSKGYEGEIVKRKSRPHEKKLHPYESKTLADLLKKITGDDEDKNDSMDFGIDFDKLFNKQCKTCDSRSISKECDDCYYNRMEIEERYNRQKMKARPKIVCDFCGHSEDDHKIDGCINYLESGYRSSPKKCGCMGELAMPKLNNGGE